MDKKTFFKLYFFIIVTLLVSNTGVASHGEELDDLSRNDLSFVGNDTDNITDCKCGEGSDGCNFKEGIKECICKLGYQQQYDICKKCDCGINSTGCTFKDGRKICSCIAGFSQGYNDDCMTDCETDKYCNYRGECYESGGNYTCDCHKGVSGTNCEIIDECKENKVQCGTDPNAKCAYDYEKRKAYCKCATKGKRFDVPSRQCVDQTPCTNHKNCTNGGQCLGKEGAQYCRCKYGTSGDFCERVEECQNNSTLCGEGSNVACRYNRYLLRAYCQCDYVNQRYDLAQRKCVDRKQCSDNRECEPYGVCFDKCQTWEPCLNYDTKEDKKSCHCIEGTSGHNCEVIDDCFNKIVDCGKGDNVHCKYSYITGMADAAAAYCQCNNSKDIFDKKDKTCKNCDCGPKGKCKLVDGKKSCTCEKGTFNQGDRCEDCKCGEGSDGCNFKEGIKECVCKLGYQQQYDTCKKCDCGINSTGCTFKDGKKICSCIAGYAQGYDGVCMNMCDDKKKCENGGRCLNDICICLSGTGGPYCEKVYACEDKLCGENGARCLYNPRDQKTYCECQDKSTTYDAYDKKCKECRCEGSDSGEKLGKCEFQYGKKICSCYENYAFNPKEDICSKCFCGKKEESEGCRFDENGNKVCQCKEGFKEHSGTCLKCKCGEHEVCKFKGDKQVVQMCDCEAGYFKSNDTCKKCECGPNGKCQYNNIRETDCICEPGFAEVSGRCLFCFCGQNSQCKFKNGTKRCGCPKGFKDIDGYCTDIDECLDPRSCKGEGTFCENTLGGYKCTCQPGYQVPSRKLSLEENLCEKTEVPHTNDRPWKIGYGVLSAVFIIIIIGLVYVIFRLRK